MMFGGVLFAPGERPLIDAIRDGDNAAAPFTISHFDRDLPGVAELLADGLTFDLTGLAPGEPVTLPVDHPCGLPPDLDPVRLEGVGLQPGPHIAGTERLLPVIRVAASTLAALSTLPGAQAVVWAPSASVTPAGWFAQVVGDWIEGGPFPALALCAVQPVQGGGLVSHGLDAIGAQDFSILPSGRTEPSDLNRLAMRIADWLVAHGPVSGPGTIALPGMGTVRVRVDQQRLVVSPDEDPAA